MSASIHWKYEEPTHYPHLDVAAPSAFLSIMHRLFGGDGPWTIHPVDMSLIRGAAAAYDFNPNPFREIISIYEAGQGFSITIWPEY